MAKKNKEVLMYRLTIRSPMGSNVIIFAIDIIYIQIYIYSLNNKSHHIYNLLQNGIDIYM